jgi:GH15 family glucan-1,4-alpha-glucosidase
VPETVLDHLEGYKGSRPVRVRNSAAQQLQLDIYGERPGDPRFLATLDRISEELVADSLVRRNELDGSDGMPGSEGTFNLSSFWCVEALTRAGRIAEGRYVFEKMLTHANHVGLFTEEIGPAGEARGNFPQAFTHLALISAATNLDRALSGEPPPA